MWTCSTARRIWIDIRTLMKRQSRQRTVARSNALVYAMFHPIRLYQHAVEAVRRLGYAARFISGYVYTPGLDAAAPSKATAGATHAWLQVYLPGAGWLAFDPTNNLIGGTDLIRVGVARHASLASPVSGSWQGVTSDYLGMTVDVQVTKRE